MNFHTFKWTMILYTIILSTFRLLQEVETFFKFHSLFSQGMTYSITYFVFSMIFSFMDGLYELHYRNYPKRHLPYCLKKSNNMYKIALRKENKQFGEKVESVIPWKQVQQAMMHVFWLFLISSIVSGMIVTYPGQMEQKRLATPLSISSIILFWTKRFKSLFYLTDLQLIFKELLWGFIGILVADVVFWTGHIITHKIKPLYEGAHKQHHQYILNFAVFGASTHILDQLLINLPVVVVPVFVCNVLLGEVDMMIIYSMITVFMFGTAVQHCSFEMFDKFLFRMVNKHDNHHKYADCEYGIGIFMDELCKTTFNHVHGRK